MKNKKKKAKLLHKSLIESCIWVVISVLIAFILYQTGSFHTLLESLNGFGYIGAFIAGLLFVSVFTAAPATVILLTFAETLPIIPLAIVAGLGAVCGDFLIMNLLTNGIDTGVNLFPNDWGVRRIIKTLRHTKYRFMLTIIGAVVIASPLPDELGLVLMGVSKVHPGMAMSLAFSLNTLGIWLLLSIFT